MIDLDFIYSNLDILIEQESKTSENKVLDIVSAKNCNLIDKDGKVYLDLTSNEQAQPLGYSFASTQESAYIANSSLFKTNSLSKLDVKIRELSKLDKIHFTASKECNYSILEDIIKSHKLKTGKETTIVSASSASQKNFTKIDNCNFVPLNNESVIKTMFTKKTAAVVIELIQISDTIEFAKSEYLKGLKKICEENNVLLIFDVSNISPHRTGKVFNYDTVIKPDAIIVTQGLGNGIPLGIVATADTINIEEHNFEPTINLAYDNAYKLIANDMDFDINEQIESVSQELAQQIEALSAEHISIGNVNINGLIITFNTEFNCYDFADKCKENSILINPISNNEILLTPPYILTREEIKQTINTFESIIREMNLFDNVE